MEAIWPSRCPLTTSGAQSIYSGHQCISRHFRNGCRCESALRRLDDEPRSTDAIKQIRASDRVPLAPFRGSHALRTPTHQHGLVHAQQATRRWPASRAPWVQVLGPCTGQIDLAPVSADHAFLRNLPDAPVSTTQSRGRGGAVCPPQSEAWKAILRRRARRHRHPLGLR